MTDDEDDGPDAVIRPLSSKPSICEGTYAHC